MFRNWLDNWHRASRVFEDRETFWLSEFETQRCLKNQAREEVNELRQRLDRALGLNEMLQKAFEGLEKDYHTLAAENADLRDKVDELQVSVFKKTFETLEKAPKRPLKPVVVVKDPPMVVMKTKRAAPKKTTPKKTTSKRRGS